MRKKLMSLLLIILMIVGMMPIATRNLDAAMIYHVKIDENIENGIVETDKAEPDPDEKVTLTATPDLDYKLKEITVTKPKDVETISDLVDLLGDATYIDEDKDGASIKIVNGMFTAYTGEGDKIAELDNATTLTIENHYTFVANYNNFTWTFTVYGEEFYRIRVTNDNEYDFWCYGKNTGSLQQKPVELTTVTEGKEYTFIMPASDVNVTAIFEDATPKILVKIDVGTGHESLFADAKTLDDIANKTGATSATINANIISLEGVKANKTENEMWNDIWTSLFDLVDSNDGIHNGEEFFNVAYKSFDDYTTIADFNNDVYDEEIHNKKVSEALTYYLLWKKPLEKLELGNGEPICNKNTKDAIPTAPAGIEIENIIWNIGEEKAEIFEGGKEYIAYVYPKINIDASLWKYFLDFEKTEIAVAGGNDVKKLDGEAFGVSFKVIVEHDFSEWKIVKEATCTEKGEEERICSHDKNHKEIREIQALGHDFGEWKIVKEATCEEKGQEERICSHDENHKETREIEILGHDFGEWTVVKEATTTEEGLEERVCKNDPTHIETRPIPKKQSGAISYVVTEGDNSEWDKGSEGNASFTFKRSEGDSETYKKFQDAKVDGRNLVRERDYFAKAGSLIIELLPSFLEKLSVGEHTLTVEFIDGNDVTVTFVIKEKEPKPIPTPTPQPIIPNTSVK